MSPAVTPIPPTTGEVARQTCSKCNVDLADSALKCGGCQGYVHYKCSGLPEYQLIRLAVSQSSYNCYDCVKAKDLKGDDEKFSLEVEKIKVQIAKEVSLAELNRSTNNDTDSTEQTGESNAENQINPTNANPFPVCKYYFCRKAANTVGEELAVITLTPSYVTATSRGVTDEVAAKRVRVATMSTLSYAQITVADLTM